METIEIKVGEHKGEVGLVVEILKDGLQKTFTLEGDIHYYKDDGAVEVAPNKK